MQEPQIPLHIMVGHVGVASALSSLVYTASALVQGPESIDYTIGRETLLLAAIAECFVLALAMFEDASWPRAERQHSLSMLISFVPALVLCIVGLWREKRDEEEEDHKSWKSLSPHTSFSATPP